MPEVVAERQYLRVIVDETFNLESPVDDYGPSRIIVADTAFGVSVLGTQNTDGLDVNMIVDLFTDAEHDEELFAEAVTEELEDVVEVYVNEWTTHDDSTRWELVIRPEGIEPEEDTDAESDLVLWLAGEYKNLILQSKKTYRNIHDPSDYMEVWTKVDDSGPIYGADENEVLAVAEEMLSEYLD